MLVSSEVTVWLEALTTRTCGWVGNATPPVIPAGGEVLQLPVVAPQQTSSFVASELTAKVVPRIVFVVRPVVEAISA